jgi:hypothetical protein
MATKQKTKGKGKAAEAEEEVELEDLDSTVEEEAPAKKKGGEEVEFGASDLAKHLTKILDNGKVITPRDLRALIRKMAREDTPRVEREIKAGNRSRYNWPGGLDNPEVKAIIKAVTGGELEADKQAKLAELKEKKAKKKAAEGKADKGKSKGKGKKTAPTEEAEDEVEEIEVD